MSAQLIKISMTGPSGQKYETTLSTQSFTIGRSPKNNLVIEDEGLSRQHCRIDFINNKFYVTDLGSTNGVFIEGARIKANVRTSFNNFLPFQVSHYDCQVNELDPTTSMFIPLELAKGNESVTKSASKKLSLRSISTAPQAVKKANKATPFYLIVVVCVVFVYFIYNQFYVNVPAIPVVEPTTSPSETSYLKIPQRVIYKSPNVLATKEKYLQKYETRSCTKQEWCESLTLDSSKDEGIYHNETEVMVFMRPELHLMKERYKSLAPENSELAPIELLLSSKVLDDYYGGTIEHIHLVLMKDNQITKVIRLHHINFDPTQVSREALMTQMLNTIESGDLKGYQEVVLPKLKIDQLNQSN